MNRLERSETQIPERYEVLAKKEATETCESERINYLKNS